MEHPARDDAQDQTTGDAAAAPAASIDLDPRTGNPRELMQALLPAARRAYVKAWELLADARTPLERRRTARERAKGFADDHAVVAAALRAREGALRGDDLLNARHLISELERHAAALERLATISPHGLLTSSDLRPEALGCGRRYRDPARATDDAASSPPAGTGRPRRGGRDRDRRSGGKPGGDRGRGGGRPAAERDRPRDPKPSRDLLGSSKHESALGDDLDEATRAKLEELRRQLGDS